MDYGILSLLPPLLAIILALTVKNVYIALFSAIFVGYAIINGCSPYSTINDTLYSVVHVFESNSNTSILVVIALLTALSYLMTQSGGVSGLVDYLTRKRQIVKNKRSSLLFTWLLGLLLFIASSPNILITGTVTHPLNDAMKVSRQKQAFFVHSVAVASCVLIPLNAWGASVAGQLEGMGAANGMAAVFQSIPLNFYAVSCVLFALFSALTDFDFGPMRAAEAAAARGEMTGAPAEENTDAPAGTTTGQAKFMVIPIAALAITMIVCMFITGNGNFLSGSGSVAVLWAAAASVIVCGILCITKKVYTFDQFLNTLFKGIGNSVPFMVILILALALSSLVSTLGTSAYLANRILVMLDPALLTGITFLLCSVMSFATGTSVGTLFVFLPLVVPVAMEMGLSVPLVTGAILGGSIFGDNCSPISDSTAMTAASTCCDPIRHIETQLPYSLAFGALSLVLYFIFGFIMT